MATATVFDRVSKDNTAVQSEGPLLSFHACTLACN